MLRLSKKADYALIAMKHLAMRPDGRSSSAREISESYDIPLELLAKVLQRLVRARLLVSVQGTRGGYRLGRQARADFGGRRDPGGRRPGDRDGVLRPTITTATSTRSAAFATRSGRSRTASSMR